MRLQKMLCLMTVVGLTACANHTPEPTSYQAALGVGIVEGTKGYQRLQEDPSMGNGIVTQKIRGQVRHIEGAAYIVQTVHLHEIRLPVDESTRIDRPAHKGDWIDAYMNEDGVAVFIRNVDDQMALE